MKKEVTIVPKDKCPLDILAEMGDRTKNAWIFLHYGAVNKLEETCNEYKELAHSIILRWNAPSTSITIETEEFSTWQQVCFIESDYIAFKFRHFDPEEIFFLKMDE